MEIKSLYIQIQNCMSSVLSVLLNTCPNQFFLKKIGGWGWGGGDILARQKILTCTLYKSFFFDVFTFKNSPYFEENESEVATNKRLVHGGRQNKYLEKILLSCLSSGKILALSSCTS